MKAEQSLAAAALALAAVLAFPGSAAACACCAEPGTWLEARQRIAPFELAELDRVRFAPEARLFLTAAGFEVVRGISVPAERYSLAQSRAGRRWTLTLREARGSAGTLSFSLPAAAVVYAVDLRDGRQGGGGGPLLYKEWRLEGPLRGTGAFAPGAAGGARFRLVLQGRGNHCLNAADFSAWRLQVSGPRAAFALYGRLARPAGG